MAATMSQLRDGIKARLATISGLRALAYIPDNITPPQAIVMPSRITYDQAFGRGSDEYAFAVMLVVGRADARNAQTSLDAYLAPSGSGSIKAAIEADSTLGGVAADCRVTDMSNVGPLMLGDTTYLTAEFQVTVIA